MKMTLKMKRNVERWKEVKKAIQQETEKIRKEKEKTPSRG